MNKSFFLENAEILMINQLSDSPCETLVLNPDNSYFRHILNFQEFMASVSKHVPYRNIVGNNIFYKFWDLCVSDDWLADFLFNILFLMLQLQQSKVQLMSTVCGHLFCNPCIKAAVRANRQCPTCRRRLSANQIHPIFL